MIIALGEGGIGTAAVMLVIVLAANLALENFVEPRVMGRTSTSTRWSYSSSPRWVVSSAASSA